MVTGKIHIDEDGYPRAIFDPPNEILGSFLEEDIQTSPQVCNLILSACNDVSNGRIGVWDDVGNAHRLIIQNGRVRISNEYSDYYSPCEVTIDEFTQVLLKWLALVSEI